MIQKQKNKTSALGVKNNCPSFLLCPLCYGCRNYDPSASICEECAEDNKKYNICNIRKHKAYLVNKMLSRNILADINI